MSTKLKISEIKPNPDNPRVIKDDAFKKLVTSLKEFPEMAEVREVVVNKDHVILGGNMRFRAMQEAGWKEVPVKIVDWPEDKQREFIVKDNVSGGEWDWDMLANEWDTDLLEDWGLDVPVSFGDQEVEEDEAPEVSTEPPVSKLGEIYQLGRHRVMCGSSTEASDVGKLFDKATIAFTSPPYNASRRPMLSERKKGVKDKVNFYEEYDDSNDDWAKLITMFYQLEQEKTDYQFINVQFLANNKRDLLRFIAAERDRFVDVAFWKKNQVAPAMAENVMNSQVECIFIFSRKDDASRAVATANFRGTVSNYIETNNAGAENKNADIHGATMPVALASHFVTNFTKPGDSVYDAFIGTGTTLIACEQTDRTCYGMELDPKYTDVIRRRWAKFVYPDRWEEEWEALTPVV